LHPHDLRDVPWQKGPHGVKEKRRRAGTVVYRLIVYPGGYAEETPTDRQQVGLVLSGRGRLQLGRRQRPLHAGQSLILPKGLSRKIKVGRNPLVLFLAEPAAKRRKRRRGGRGRKPSPGAPPAAE
ncbi:MAG TPA: cupin domain-containing protein, partial [Candidatus Thermoplasmatota archaeon]|nr:cupin domain-containing protein [Candidatus Thermoplasmatota archaeon]